MLTKPLPVSKPVLLVLGNEEQRLVDWPKISQKIALTLAENYLPSFFKSKIKTDIGLPGFFDGFLL